MIFNIKHKITLAVCKFFLRLLFLIDLILILIF